MNLLSHYFFRGFDPEDAVLLAATAEIKEYPARMEIFKEGDQSDSIFLVLQGQVQMPRAVPNAPARIIATAGANDYFGEMGVLDSSKRSTGAVTMESTTLARIPSELFVKRLNELPGRCAMSFMHQVLNHLRETNDRYMSEVVRKEKMTLVGEMANTIIHDIRGPFTSVQLGTELIMDKHQDDETRELCEMMKGQIGRVKGMAEELLEFARGTSTVNREEVDLAELLKQFLFLNRDFIASTSVKVEAKIENIRIEADPNKLLRVFQNLLNNSVEALKSQPNALVIITTVPDNDHVEVRLQDNGPGIPDVIKDRLFEPFVTHGKKNGTGLGMAITKSIIEAHKGRIHFETGPGTGTAFIIRLPQLGK